MYLRHIDNYPDLKDGRCEVMTGFDGRKIRVALWQSPSSAPKGTIVLLQGRAEFIEKYYETIGELRARGFAVATMDWRGQGASERLLDDKLIGHVEHFSDYGKDLEQFVKQFALPDCPTPHFAMAHSMGSLILLHQLPRLRTAIERAMLCAPLIQIAPERRRFMGKQLRQSTVRKTAQLLRFLGRGKKYMISAERTPFDRHGFTANALTSDGPRYDRNRQFVIDYPELGVAGPSAKWVHESCKAMKALQSSDMQSTICTPALIVTANKDRIADPRAAEYFAKTTRAIHAVGIAGSLHEIMMERTIIREQYWAAFDSFIPGENLPKRESIE